MARTDPLNNTRFRVEIDGITAAGFSEVLIGASSTEVIAYREGSDPAHARKLAGLTKHGDITLKRGYIASTELFRWYREITLGNLHDNRKNVLIVVQDAAGADSLRFRVLAAWPIRYAPGALNAQGNQIFVEELVLTHEGIELDA